MTSGPLGLSVNDCVEAFKIQCVKDQHLRDPFVAPVPFNQAKMDQVHSDHSKVRIGIITENPFLPVSKSVKRAIQMTRDALISEGYEVVAANITKEEYAEGRNFVAI